MKRKVTHAAIVERIFRKIEPDNFVSVYIQGKMSGKQLMVSGCLVLLL